MRKYFTLLLLSASIIAFGQTSTEKIRTSKQVTKYLDEISDLIRKHSLFADAINWNELDQKISSLSAGMQDIKECRPVIDTIIKTLRRAGDNHSFYMPKEEVQRQNSDTFKTQQAESKYLDNGIAYLKVPGFLPNNVDAGVEFATSIQNQIKVLDESNTITGWIVDLRNNTGGTMWPMVAGLSPLTNNDAFGYIISPKKEQAFFRTNGNIRVKDPYTIKNQSVKIAVLINSMTGSSGEFTAISFEGLPNTRFFGQRSGGATTSNFSYRLSDGGYLLLAVAYMADRNRKKYIGGINPDVQTEIPSGANGDPAIDAAKKWIGGN